MNPYMQILAERVWDHASYLRVMDTLLALGIKARVRVKMGRA